MKKSVAFLFSIILVATAIFTVLPALAEYRTIVVPSQYPTLEAAIANAHNGDTILIKTGTHEGPINQTIIIDKTLSIIGEGVENTIINLHPTYNSSWVLTQQFFSFSDAVTIIANDCKLINLTLSAMPGGDVSVVGDHFQFIGCNIITDVLLNGSSCKIVNNDFSRLWLNGSFNEVLDNKVNHLDVIGSSNVVKDNFCQGLGLSFSTNNVVSHNKVWSDSRGYSGISLSNCTGNVVSNNEVSGFSSSFRLKFSSNNIIIANLIEDSLRSFNLLGSFNNRIYLNNIVNKNTWNLYVYDNYADPVFRDNYPDLTVSSNIWDNGTVGNYWGNYSGTDLNGDGIGDTPYIMKTAFYVHGQDPSELVCGSDSFPLMKPVDINLIVNELPSSTTNIPTTETPTYEPKQNEPFPTTTVIALSSISIGSITICLLYLNRKKAVKQKRPDFYLSQNSRVRRN
ncbi:MAG: nitrous oxide reductase family maturation protein NosD [Candidatus Bathyarchaeia archaeon]|jgi:parallel beta-helix repeat protein